MINWFGFEHLKGEKEGGGGGDLKGGVEVLIKIATLLGSSLFTCKTHMIRTWTKYT